MPQPAVTLRSGVLASISSTGPGARPRDSTGASFHLTVGQPVSSAEPWSFWNFSHRLRLVWSFSGILVLVVLLILFNDPSFEVLKPSQMTAESVEAVLSPSTTPTTTTLQDTGRQQMPAASTTAVQFNESQIPSPNASSKCSPECFDHGTCNEELGTCQCLASWGGADCDAPAMPACHLAENYWTPCFLLTTCECLYECGKQVLAVSQQCFRGTNKDGSRITNLTQIFSGPRYEVQWNSDYSAVVPPTYDREPVDTTPSPVAEPQQCPLNCSGRGVCSRESHQCQCGWAAMGEGCSDSAAYFPFPCLNQCRGKGTCEFGQCRCDQGYFGTDCALFIAEDGQTRMIASAPFAWAPSIPPQVPTPDVRPRVYVYDLPPVFNTWQTLFGTGLDWMDPIWFWERLLNSRHRVADPETADFFYIPLILRTRPSQMENIVAHAVRHVSEKYPYFDRKNGSDHIVLTNNDWGNCHLDGPSGRGVLPVPLENLVTLTLWGHSKNMAMQDERPCFRPGWDIAIPPQMDPVVYRFAPNFPYPEPPGGDSSANRTIFLYFRGTSYAEDKCVEGKFCLSLGARQALFTHFEGRYNETGVLLETMKTFDSTWHLKQFLNSVFCYAPAGFGWAMRTTQAAILGCIPVVVQPNVLQPFQDDGLNWDEFAVILKLEDVPRIHTILRNMSESEVLKKRQACFRVRSKFVWASTNLNPLWFMEKEEQGKRAAQILDQDAFSGVMDALRLRIGQSGLTDKHRR